MFKTYDSTGNETTELKKHLLESPTVETQHLIIAEWNLNSAENIKEIGNYRYGPNQNDVPFSLASNFQLETSETANPKYYGSTDADVIIDNGYDKDYTPISITTEINKNKFYYSLEDCFNRFRPRSGINVALSPKDLSTRKMFFNNLNDYFPQRPRFYVANKENIFKYWSSYVRKESETKKEYGISTKPAGTGNGYYIDNCVPFVVYQNNINANRIIIKMQTGVSDIDLGTFTDKFGSYSDPFYGDINKEVPQKWRVDKLVGTHTSNTWTEIVSLNDYTVRNDGYVELVYGPVIPLQYQYSFLYVGEYPSVASLPETSINGYAYLIEVNNMYYYYIWNEEEQTYDYFSATPEWQPTENLLDRVKPYVTNFIQNNNTIKEYDTFLGLRIVVETMNRQNQSFNLIELSPRLSADLSDKTISYTVDKKGGDLSDTGFPSGDILASTGSISIFDYDQSFDKNNTSSIIKDTFFKNLQFKFYQKILNINGFDYTIPIKTLYIDGFPESNYEERTIDINLRDLFFYFESLTAPELFLRNKPLKYIISLLLDSVGFSNYDFKYVPGEADTIIPNFYVGPDKSLALVLQDLALSTQSSMFFDEENNFIVMSKNYMMPSKGARVGNPNFDDTDLTLSGSTDQTKYIESENITTPNTNISNIVSISASNHDIFNDGKIIYSNKYIQKNISNLEQASKLDYEKNYTYQPVLLWELASNSSNNNVKENESANSSYVLSAVSLAKDLDDNEPYVTTNKILINNTINVGEMVYWLNNYSGYLMANGEIIKYDAKQYSVTGIGNVWVSSENDKQYYFAKVPYGGQMKPTGIVRIYAEPNYNSDGTYKIGTVAKHGRGQFGTNIVSHNAGLNALWSSNKRGFLNDFDYISGKKTIKTNTSGFLFEDDGIRQIAAPAANLPAGKGFVVPGLSTNESPTGYLEDSASYSSINGIIKNNLASNYISGIERKTTIDNLIGAVQSSALVFTGNQINKKTDPINFVSYSYRDIDFVPSKVGARLRFLGQQTKNEYLPQLPAGAMNFYPTQNLTVNNNTEIYDVSGSSAGIGIFINPETNDGYYFEVAALASYLSSSDTNVWFYKLNRKSVPSIMDGNDSFASQLNFKTIDYNTIEGNSFGDINNSKLRSANTGNLITSGLEVGRRVQINKINNLTNGYYKIVDVGSNTKPWRLERDELAVPEVLFKGSSDILVDYAGFVGSSRIMPNDKTPVYDLKIEWQTEREGIRFNLYINDVNVGSVYDKSNRPKTTNIAILNRGTSKTMVEHVYAISSVNASGNTTNNISDASKIYEFDKISIADSFRAHRINESMILNYLGGFGTTNQTSIFYDEFGTILRECAYFNVRYDKAYPALTAKIANTYNPLLGYYISNFVATPYGAEFMVFNTTDSPLVMDSSTGNYLRINGNAFTAESNEELTVDEYFDLINDYSQYSSSGLPKNTDNVKNDLINIKNSRMTYGRKEFSLDAPYIQDRDTAYSMMQWMIEKIKKEKIAIGIEVFGLPIIQIGDIIKIDYTSNNIINIPKDSRFVVYCINHNVSADNISQTIYLSEVS